MSRSAPVLAVLIALMPVAIEVPTGADSSGHEPSSTRLRVAGGYGSYAFISRGCEGQVVSKIPAHFHDVAGAIEHHDGASHFTVGVRGGQVSDEISSPSSGLTPDGAGHTTWDNAYVNPYLAFEPGPVSVSLGAVFHQREFITADELARVQADHPLNDFSAHLRVGRLEGQYFEASWMEGMPIASGGGYLTAGIGGRPERRVPFDLFVGLGAGGPYEGAGIALRAGYELAPGLTIGARSRIGSSGGANASGVGLALDYRFGR